jgi:tetratricopeptide (TPR) repeat protein
MTEQLFDVFLAHHSADKPFVREINTKLKQRGLKTWIDEEQIAPGQSFQEAIQQAIPRVKTAAIILGKDGIGLWQHWEIQAFFSQLVNANKTVIPVLLPGLDKVPEDLLFLQQLRWINFKNVEDSDSLGLLIWGITGERPQQELKEKPLSTTSTETIKPSSFDADTYFNQGLAKRESGDYKGAIADYNQAIQIKPDFAEAYKNRGSAKDDLGDYQGAIADYNQAIQLKPDYVEAYICRELVKYSLAGDYDIRGLFKSKSEDYQGAITDYNQAIKIKPDYADAYYGRGNAKSNLGDKQGAITDFNQAIQIKPDYVNAYNNRGLTKYNLGDKQGAIADYNQAIQIKPDYADVYYNRGNAKYNLGDKQGAIADYNQAAQIYSQQSNMEMYRKALNKIKYLEKGFWGSLFS